MIKLNEFRPISWLELPNEDRTFSKFPVIDAHNHLGRTVFPESASNQFNVKADPASVFESMKKFNIKHIVNLDGYPDERLDIQIKAYVDKYPGHFSIFTRVNFTELEGPNFSGWVEKHLSYYVNKGVTGIKIPKTEAGLKLQLKDGSYLKPDNDLLRPLWEGAAKYNIPVLMHIADPVAFFDKVIDHTNERYDELAEHPDWSYGNSDCPRFKELLDCQENMLRKNPGTRFIIPHVGSYAENLKEVARMLDTYPNMYTDTAERIAELGRQPYSSRSLSDLRRNLQKRKSKIK